MGGRGEPRLVAACVGGGGGRRRFPRNALSGRVSGPNGRREPGEGNKQGRRSPLFLILGLGGSLNLSPKGSGDRSWATRAAASQKPVRDSWGRSCSVRPAGPQSARPKRAMPPGGHSPGAPGTARVPKPGQTSARAAHPRSGPADSRARPGGGRSR